MKLCGLVPYFQIYIYVIGPPILLQKIGGLIVTQYKSITDT
jgi:hypothetical protein